MISYYLFNLKRCWQLLAIALFLSLFMSCSTTGRLFIEKKEGFKLSKDEKMVSIEPDYTLINLSKKTDKGRIKNLNREKTLTKKIGKASKTHRIDLQIVDAHSLDKQNTDYFNYLLPLKRFIIDAGFNENKQISKSSASLFSVTKYEFNEPIVLPSRFSFLREKYGTPYFSVQGMLSLKKAGFLGFPKKETIFFHFMVDIVNSEMLYREFRLLKKTASINDIDIIIYDSFKILRKK